MLTRRENTPLNERLKMRNRVRQRNKYQQRRSEGENALNVDKWFAGEANIESVID